MAKWENVGQIKGEKGDKGERGEKGEKGDKGDTPTGAYINGSGGGTLNTGNPLSAGGMVTNGDTLFLGVNSSVFVTDKKGYNSGNGLTYKPIYAESFNTPSGKPDVLTSDNIKTGSVTVPVPTANEDVTHTVTFDKPFDEVPTVTANYSTTVPHILTPIGITDVTKSSFKVNFQRTTATSTIISWIAVSF